MSRGEAPPPQIGNAKRAASWVVIGTGASQLLRLAGNVGLARLLAPEMFGLMTLVNTVLRGLYLFSDIGIGPNIVQHKRGADPDFLRTAWSLQAVRGTVLWLILLALAHPIAAFYESSELFPLLMVCGSCAFFAGLNSPSLFILQKRVKVGLLTGIDLGTQVIQLIVMIVWAFISPSVWSLAAGSVVAAILKAAMSHMIKEGPRMKLEWNWEIFSELRTFGQWIFFSTALTFLSSQTDRLMLGKMLDPALFGVYAIASNLAQVPEFVLKRLGSQVIFPVLSHNKELPRKQLNKKFLGARKKILLLLGPMVAFGVVFGDIPIRILYTEEYQGAAWMFPLLITGMWLSILGVSSSQVPFAFGKASYIAAATGTRFITIVIALPVAIHFWGLLGAVCVMALSEIPVYLVNLFAVHRLKMPCFSQDVVATGIFLVFCIAVFLLRSAIGYPHPLVEVMTST